MEEQIENKNFSPASGGVLPGGILPDLAQPHDLQVEKAVLAAMLREPRPNVDIASEHFGDSAGRVFYSRSHFAIYEALLEVYKDNCEKTDLISVASELKKRGKLDSVGGEMYLAEIYNCIATSANIDNWCEILNSHAMLRRMIDTCGSAMMKCYNSDADPAALVGEIENDIYRIRNDRTEHRIVKIPDAIKSEFEVLMKICSGEIETGIPTGFSKIDEMTGGLKPGELFILAARPSIGKTALAMNIIRNMVLPSRTPHPRRVMFFSLEMTSAQIARRFLCTESQIPEYMFRTRKVKTHAEILRLSQAGEAFRQAELYIDDTSGLSISELRAKVRRMHYSLGGLDCVVIDYLTLMRGEGRFESRQLEVAQISSGLKGLAKDLNLPVLALAQLNREVDKTLGANARPKLAHLRESGSIEQDADIVTFLHRDRDLTKGEQGEGSDAEWIVEKNRNGATGVVKLQFFPSRMEFTLPACEPENFSARAADKSK